MSVELKIKSKHLSEEARIIRFEEHKYRKQVDWLKERQQPHFNEHNTMMSLKLHRRWDVRNENRATFLARAYLAGKSYAELEANCSDKAFLAQYILPRVCDMINKYGPSETRLHKKWNADKKRYEYDPKEWATFTGKIMKWANVA